ncbi:MULTISPECIES: phosphoserine transaminase [Methylosinus]|uniref:phosphoserine transaminase n=1 Tax=Methylosinus trichosporium (strain ATCC 35070 / NCIMB 11131 / UNIQEM 75 / OB3b) TaxID=595536 RepID=A0A2D2D007_METT3|nr:MULTISPECIES: phosphoserine transaminase [Methylosinus]ATQ68320.1 phosphoserine transaminase [Methylosinus trichosporium OB3b]OBS50941.1 phosphoserine aminotransferase [Methylosinus sp. 3S-1]
MAIEKPGVKPANPRFSSGPCSKHPGWRLENLAGAALGRSHRAPAGKGKLKEAIDLTREVLRVPADHRIAIVPASDTGAVEMALWSLIGARGVDVAAWESFSGDWVTDIIEQLKPGGARSFVAPFGELPDMSRIDFDNDFVFAWNGTTAGVRVPNADFIPADRKGLTICDATSAAFAQPLDFAKLDVVTYSWQKVLGGEAAHGMLILSPRAVERLESYTPAWPLPKIFRLTKNGKLNESIFEGETINTPSLLCVEDYLDALKWAKSIGGLDALFARANANAAAVSAWVETTPAFTHLAQDAATRSNTGVCLVFGEPAVAALSRDAQWALAKEIVALIEKEGAGFDFGAYRDAPPGLRIWCGATVETSDVTALTRWIDWAYAEARSQMAKAA